MTKFIRYERNGVCAVVTPLVFDQLQEWYADLYQRAAKDCCRAMPPSFSYPATGMSPFPRPIFTFVDAALMDRLGAYVTGDLAMMRRLLAGHRVADVVCGFHVPFSSGEYADPDRSVARRAMDCHTTGPELMSTFGLQTGLPRLHRRPAAMEPDVPDLTPAA